MREIILISSLLASIQLSAQTVQREVYASSGETISATGISVNYTIGETFIQSGNGEGILLFAGFESGDPEEVVTGERVLTENDLSLYPVPVQNTLTIKSEDQSWDKVEVFSVTGEMILSRKYENTSQQIDLNQLMPGVYNCKFTKGKKSITYKVSKI